MMLNVFMKENYIIPVLLQASMGVIGTTLYRAGIGVFFSCSVIHPVAADDEYNSRNQKSQQMPVVVLFQREQYHPQRKQDQRQQAMMMPVSLPKGIHANSKSEEDHTVFKTRIADDVDAKQRQAA